MKGIRIVVIILVLTAAGLGVGAWLYAASVNSGTVSGQVVDDQGSIAGAHVRVRATENLVFSDHEGQFILEDLSENFPIEVTAWFSGYYISSTLVTPTVGGLEIILRPYHLSDHATYTWTSPISGTSDSACGRCHPAIIRRWQKNAHGQAISNPRFFSMYEGKNLSGTATVDPGYLLDFPETAGNCANCHGPGASVDGYLTTRMDKVRDQVTAGIHCDFCHKVGGIYINPVDKSVYPNVPGVQSLNVLRPPPGDNIFFGPYDDIPDPDTYLPVMKQSQYCAPCHQFSFWGTTIYESYSEWLSSPYAKAGVSCQECHMPPSGDVYFADPKEGGLPHPPEQIRAHFQLGASDEDLFSGTVDMSLDLEQSYSLLKVTVTITNSGAGHHVPTDHPGRHMILNLNVQNDNGMSLQQIGGSVIPDWGGEQAGDPGTIFAKVLRDINSGEFPTVNYWKPTQIVTDNRIAALTSDISTYYFYLPEGTRQANVEVELIFRRLFAATAQEKGWSDPDFSMSQAQETTVLTDFYLSYLPIIGR